MAVKQYPRGGGVCPKCSLPVLVTHLDKIHVVYLDCTDEECEFYRRISSALEVEIILLQMGIAPSTAPYPFSAKGE